MMDNGEIDFLVCPFFLQCHGKQLIPPQLVHTATERTTLALIGFDVKLSATILHDVPIFILAHPVIIANIRIDQDILHRIRPAFRLALLVIALALITATGSELLLSQFMFDKP